MSSGSINNYSSIATIDGERKSYGTLPTVLHSVSSDTEEDPLLQKKTEVFNTPPPNASVVNK